METSVPQVTAPASGSDAAQGLRAQQGIMVQEPAPGSTSPMTHPVPTPPEAALDAPQAPQTPQAPQAFTPLPYLFQDPPQQPLHQPPLRVERKFLVGEVPRILRLEGGRQVAHGYLAVENSGTEVRVVRSGDESLLCVKTSRDGQFTETEIQLTPEQAAALWPLTEGRRMSKISYTVDVGETPVTLDMYEGQLNWLRIAEAEFKNFQSAENFSPPPWFQREVTDVHAYRHSNLARE